MDRLEYIRDKVDVLLETVHDRNTKKFAYIHLYGTSQLATMLAINEHLDIELCAIAGMMHDISLYALNSGHDAHAERSAEAAKSILIESEMFSEEEISIITHAIRKHSDKNSKQDGVYAEVLKDADVLAHYLYNVNISVPAQDKVRLFYLLEYIQSPRKK